MSRSCTDHADQPPRNAVVRPRCASTRSWVMTPSRRRRSLAILGAMPLAALPLAALLLAAAAASPALADHGDRVEHIAKARRQALGTTVTVRGTVTVPSNAFDAGFAIQDGNAGIYVLDSGGAVRALGAEVEVTGTLVDSFGLLAIQPSAITALGSGRQVKPQRTKTGKVGEATEGRLLELDGTMVGDLVDDSPFGFKLDIDDGSGLIQIFLFPGTGIATEGLVDGAAIHLVCFSNQFDVFFECDPRGPADLQIE